MKREQLKFRVWTGFQMEYNVTVGKFGAFYVNPANNGLDEKDAASLTPFNTKYADGTPVMQFTGLLDKHGNEIYGGDILKKQLDYWVGSAGTHKGKTEVVEVVDWGTWCWIKKDKNTPLDPIEARTFEIAGNRFEHPHLLTPQQVK